MILSTNEAQKGFIKAIIEAGLAPPREVIPDGRIHRFSTSGKARDVSGWYVLHLDGKPAGVFGDWRSGISQTWVDSSQPPMTQAEREAFNQKVKAAREADRAEQEARYKAAAMTCQARWDAASPAPDKHPYLTRKGVGAHGVRVEPSNVLLVPVCNDLSNAIVQTLQTISPRGDKFFVRDGKAKGGFFALGLGDCTTEPPIVIVVCEGFATGATIHEATGLPVIVAFNAGNLQAVCTAIYCLLPDVPLVVAADDDWMTCPNTGIEAATQAALSVGGVMVKPWFDLRSRTPKATDFNDMAMASGLDAVRDVFDGVLSDEGV